MNPDGTIMSSLIKQHSWDDKRKTGSFQKNKENPKGRVIVKLGESEVGGMVDSIESNREFSTYHSSQNQVLQIKFSPYLDKKTGEQKGFSFSVNKQDKQDTTNKVGFVIGFTFPEARYLKEYFSFILNKVFEQKLNQSITKSNYKKPVEAVETSDTDGDSDEDFEW
jgi:hypothetical protein